MRPLFFVTITAVVGGILTRPACAQTLADRIAPIRDGAIRLSFATRAGVCGDGEFIGEDTPGGFRTYIVYSGGFSISNYEHVRPACNTGPLRLVVEKRGGAVSELSAAVGVAWRPLGAAADLGPVPAAEAAAWLVDLAPRLTDESDVRVALLAASMADSARIADRMIVMARDRGATPAIRSAAMRWLRGPAEREGRAPQADRALREILGDASERPGLREQALRRLGESRDEDNARWVADLALARSEPLALRERAVRVLGGDLRRPDLVRSLYARLEPVALKERVVRVAGAERGPEAAAWLRQLATSNGEPVAVRERAIRVLGERGEIAYLRELYPRLDRTELRERVIRMIAESGGGDALAWIERVALDRGEQTALRERAVRELAGRGMQTADLVRLYDRADDTTVRGRLIRIFGERRDRASLDKLAAILRDDPDPSLRRAAQRRIGEAGANLRE